MANLKKCPYYRGPIEDPAKELERLFTKGTPEGRTPLLSLPDSVLNLLNELNRYKPTKVVIARKVTPVTPSSPQKELGTYKRDTENQKENKKAHVNCGNEFDEEQQQDPGTNFLKANNQYEHITNSIDDLKLSSQEDSEDQLQEQLTDNHPGAIIKQDLSATTLRQFFQEFKAYPTVVDDSYTPYSFTAEDHANDYTQGEEFDSNQIQYFTDKEDSTTNWNLENQEDVLQGSQGVGPTSGGNQIPNATDDEIWASFVKSEGWENLLPEESQGVDLASGGNQIPTVTDDEIWDSFVKSEGWENLLPEESQGVDLASGGNQIPTVTDDESWATFVKSEGWGHLLSEESQEVGLASDGNQIPNSSVKENSAANSKSEELDAILQDILGDGLASFGNQIPNVKDKEISATNSKSEELDDILQDILADGLASFGNKIPNVKDKENSATNSKSEELDDILQDLLGVSLTNSDNQKPNVTGNPVVNDTVCQTELRIDSENQSLPTPQPRTPITTQNLIPTQSVIPQRNPIPTQQAIRTRRPIIPTRKPITTQQAIPTRNPTTTREDLFPSQNIIPQRIPTPTQNPIPPLPIFTLPTPATPEELHRYRVKLLNIIKEKEIQGAIDRDKRLQDFQRAEILEREYKIDFERQTRILNESAGGQRDQQDENRLTENPDYKHPTKAELKLLKKLATQQKKQLLYHRYPPTRRTPLTTSTITTALKLRPKMMHNEMVSIPVGNLNGGLKAASSGSGVGTGSVVSSAVLANAPRVYLTPTATFMANRQAAQVTGKIGGATIVSGSVAPATATVTSGGGTVRYFSQFSKMQTTGCVAAPNLQRKLVNGDTIVLSNGTKSRILTSSERISANSGVVTTATVAATAAAATAAATAAAAARAVATAATATAAASVLPTTTNGGGSSFNKIDLLPPEGTVINNNADQKAVAEVANNSIQPNQPEDQLAAQQANSSDANEPELDITINNVVCSFSVRCHLKLREIALNGNNVEYRRENGMVTMKLRHPYTTASIWSSGRITCTGATSEPMAKVAARRYARCLGNLGFPTRFQNFRIVNVLGTCSMPWAIKIVNFSERHRENASYEPELHPGVTYKMTSPKATLKIFSTGSITVTAASVNDVESAIQHIYPLVLEFAKQRSKEELLHLRQKQRQNGTAGPDPNDLDGILVSEKNTLNSVGEGGSNSNSNSSTQMFPGSTNTATALNASKPSATTTSSSDNICASARRRATECWATKLQNKRPRYNDPSTITTTTTTTKNAVLSSSNAFSSVASTSAQAQVHLRNPLKTAALANARIRGTAAQLPVNQLAMNQNSSAAIASRRGSIGGVSGTSAGYLQIQQRQQQQQRLLLQQQQQQQQQQRQLQQQKLMDQQRSFSPSDFLVDDLIEEEESNELDMFGAFR